LDDPSNFSICFLNISLICSIVKKSFFDEISLSEQIGAEIADEEQGGGAVKTFEAKIKTCKEEINRFVFITIICCC
jgi:hypothetical protein